jgi:multidrug efflux pump subunit AcrA (membrane-fusion protein)
LIHEAQALGSTPDAKRVADLAVKDAEKVLQVNTFNRDADLRVQTASLTLAKLQQENADRDLRRKKKVLDSAVVRSPVRGRASFIDVYKGPGKVNTPIQVGEQRSQGWDLCVICDISALRVRVLVSEADIKHVAVGQHATVKLRALDKEFTARVAKLGLVAQDKNVALSGLASRRSGEAFVNVIEAKLDFVGLTESDMRKLRIGYTADVTIDLDGAPDALQIPWGAVAYDKTGAPFTEVLAPAGAEHRLLKLGGFNCNRVQVLEGVREGEKVRVNFQ